MAAPTQQYPPWLTPVPNTIYGPGGVPISTSTTILYLPLTYYGPSIPLGSEWIYGGLTPPASTSTLVVPTTVIPTTFTSTATPPTTSTSTSSSTPITSPSQLSSSTILPTAIPPPSRHALSHNQLIGIVVGAVIGALVIFLALFVCFLVIKNRRREQRVRFKNGLLPIEKDYVVVDEDLHVPGDGSPRQSGDGERDSLLQAHNGTPGPSSPPRYQKTPGIPVDLPVAGPSSQPTQQATPEFGARPGITRVPVLPPDTYSSNNSGSGSSTDMSSLGSLVPNSRLSALSPLYEERLGMQRTAMAAHFRGPILTPLEQRRVEEQVRPDSKDSQQQASLTSLLPPPRSTDLENSPGLTPRGSSSSSTHVRTAFIPYLQRNIKLDDTYGSSNRSSVQTDPEDAALLTARRVKPVEWDARAAPYYHPPSPDQPSDNTRSSGGILSSISSRLSWFKNLDALPGSLNRRSRTPQNFNVSDKDAEAGRALLSPDYPGHRSAPSDRLRVPLVTDESYQLDVPPPPFAAIGLHADGTRPLSAISGSSGGATSFHDAYSTFPNTPLLTPLPRAVTPAGSLSSQPSMESNWRISSPLSVGVSAASLRAESEQAQQQAPHIPVEFGGREIDPPAYDENDTIAREHARGFTDYSVGVDVLDLPAPSALPTFRNTAVPMSAFASTSTAFSNANTANSIPAPTLFTQREGTLSTSTSDSSLKDSTNETVAAGRSIISSPSKQGSGPGSPSHSVQVPSADAEAFGIGEAKSWSDGSAAGNGSFSGRTATYYDAPAVPHFTSRETSMTGTTLATIDENTTSTAISIDLYEDEPPAPGEGWRTLAGVPGGGGAAGVLQSVNRRFTLGAPMSHRQGQHGMLTEIGSLQSIRSQLSSTRSTGSAPTSRRDASGSLGSRLSVRHSLTHSGSISSLEGRRRHPSSLRYSVYSASSSGGGVSPALSAFGNRVGRQGSDDGLAVPRTLSPHPQQYAIESYYTPPESMSGRSTSGTQDMTSTFHSAMTAQTMGTAGTALMEVEEDVVDAARAAMNSGRDRELGVLSPRSRANDLDTSLGLSSAPWATGLDQSWTPL
ncbi:hypothetical protein APHAL10511_007821 [Amanita phalloides]|nr:hypothetical protein APHAL10511_007821 [Amanita phalloides]